MQQDGLTPAGRGRASETAKRSVIMSDGDRFAMATLETWEDGARLATFDPLDELVVGVALFSSRDAGATGLDDFVFRHEEAEGWFMIYDGPPLRDDARPEPVNVSVTVERADAEPLGGDDAADEADETVEPFVVLAHKGPLTATLALEKRAHGAAVNGTMQHEGITLLIPPAQFDREDEADAQLRSARESLGASGWREFYAGPPLKG